MRPLSSKPDRILCFDIENKPGTYGPGDYTHPKVTAFAGRFLNETRGHSWVLNRSRRGPMRDAVAEFQAMWNEADVVMGHNIRGHDIKILNGLLVTVGLPVLEQKRTIDTLRDTPRTRGFSRSLENWCARWDSPIDKIHIPEHIWEDAGDGIPEAMEMVRLRCANDVEMNIWLHSELRRRSYLS